MDLDSFPKIYLRLSLKRPLVVNFCLCKFQTGDILVGENHPVRGSEPWTQQSQGCGRPGEFIYLPYPSVSPSNNTTDVGRRLANQWLRLRYGVFEDMEGGRRQQMVMAGVSVASRQHSLCRGRSVRNVVLGHADFQSSLQAVNFTVPRFSVTRRSAPKYVVVLENSQAMNMRDHWDFIRTSLKKFMVHDLPDEAHVGLVLFNSAAHVAFPVSVLGPRASPKTRNGLAYSIKNKYNLSPSTGSCVRCGISKAIEALQTSGSSSGGVVVLISRGGVTSLSLNEEKEAEELARKHSLQVFSVSIPLPPVTDISTSLERLAHNTMGESFFIVDESYGDRSTLATYVGLTETFREIQRRTLTDSPSLVSDTFIFLLHFMARHRRIPRGAGGGGGS